MDRYILWVQLALIVVFGWVIMSQMNGGGHRERLGDPSHDDLRGWDDPLNPPQVFTDPKTGCEYIAIYRVGIYPRINTTCWVGQE